MNIKAPKNPYILTDVSIKGLYGTLLKSWMVNPVSEATTPRAWRMYLGIRGIGHTYAHRIYEHRTKSTLVFARKVKRLVDSPTWGDCRILCLKENEDEGECGDHVNIWPQWSRKNIEQWVELKKLRPNLEDEDIGMLELKMITNPYRGNNEPARMMKTTAFFDRFQWGFVKNYFEGFASLVDACESRR